ncbi:MAG: hypothetical protein ABI634_13280 [Acidobacteriota bacterium]
MNTIRRTFFVIVGLALVTGSWSAAAQFGDNRNDQARGNGRLSGTYQLDRGRSDKPQQIANRVTRSLDSGQRDRAYQDLMMRLDSPEMLAIDLSGRTVSITSSNAPRLTFNADGRDQTEIGMGGRPMTTHADLRGDGLTVSTSGNRGRDFTVTFEPFQGGLRVTRELDSDALRTPVTVRSVYRRVADQPRWNVYSDEGRTIVPDGTQIRARLDRDLNMRNVREGERFTMTVMNGGAYRGAVITGIVGRMHARDGRTTEMVVDFELIRLNSGRTGPFEGDIESVRTPDGRDLRVDRSGVVRDRSRDDSSTIQSGAVGATLGAIIGAIAGGGKGAAIGAIAGGAGMILIDQGRDDTGLRGGTQFTISAIAPRFQPFDRERR